MLWLCWHGAGTPELNVVWRASVRRFDLEHAFRFLKQTLEWATPRLRHSAQADRWTWLLIGAYAQPRLARRCVADVRLPWQQPQRAGRFTPARVQQAFPRLLLRLGTPTVPSERCGRSPGRPRDSRADPAPGYPAVKKIA